MNNPSEQQLAEFRQQVSAWIKQNQPQDPSFMLPLSFLEVGSEQQLDFLREWQYKVWKAGYLGMAWPKEFGGMGVDPIYQQIADEEMLSHRTPIIFNTIGLGWAGPLILDIGSQQNKEQYLKPILTGEHIWCQGFSEPDHGSDLGSVQTRAVRDADEYIINGSKIWTTMGNFGDHMILLARTNPDTESRYAGLSFFLAPMKIAGIETTPIKKLSGEYGFTQTFFNDARIPSSTLIGSEGQGWSIAMQTLLYERGAQAGSAGGVSLTHLYIDDVIEMIKPLTRDGELLLNDPIIRQQLTQFKMEEQALNLNRTRADIAALTSDYPMSIPLSDKLASTELARRIRQFTLKLQGASGACYVGDTAAIDDAYWQRAYFNNFGTTIGGGTSQIQANIIGEHILGLAKG